MSSTSVSVLLPLRARRFERDIATTIDAIRTFLESTGFEFEIVTQRGDDYGVLIRRGISEAKGETIDIVFGTTRDDERGYAIIRRLLVSRLPDPRIRLKAFSADAARLVAGETKIDGAECDLEMAFLANKYGFRVEMLRVGARMNDVEPSFTAIRSISAAFGIRLTNRR